MTKKTEKKLIYTGLGFPVELRNVEMVEFDGEWHPKIDVRKVADAAIEALVSQESRLTGNQVKFIRSYFSMSLRKFGTDVVKESHAAVKKWEDTRDKTTNMDLNIEIMLRLYVFDKIILPKKQENDFHEQYKRLQSMEMSAKTSNLILRNCTQAHC